MIQLLNNSLGFSIGNLPFVMASGDFVGVPPGATTTPLIAALCEGDQVEPGTIVHMFRMSTVPPRQEVEEVGAGMIYLRDSAGIRTVAFANWGEDSGFHGTWTAASSCLELRFNCSGNCSVEFRVSRHPESIHVLRIFNFGILGST